MRSFKNSLNALRWEGSAGTEVDSVTVEYSAWVGPPPWCVTAPATARTFGVSGSSIFGGADSALTRDDSQKSGTKGWGVSDDLTECIHGTRHTT